MHVESRVPQGTGGHIRGTQEGEVAMSYTFPECPRCQTTARPADKNPDGGGYICWECSLEFDEPGSTKQD